MRINANELFPIVLSLKVAMFSTLLCILIGIPIAYFLSIKKGKLFSVIDSLTNLPIVLPPTVLGYYLLVLLGRNSIIGRFLEEELNIMIVFTQRGAIIAATIVALPYIIKSAKTSFCEINNDYINAARLLGRRDLNIFFTIVMPICLRGILAGVTLSFARALGDFGTTLMISGSIPKKTQTMPIAIYDALQAGETAKGNLLVLVMTVIALIVVFLINILENKYKKGAV